MYISIPIIIIGLIFLAQALVFCDSTVVHAKIRSDSESRGSSHLVYYYSYKGVVYSGKLLVKDGMCPRYDCYQNSDSIEVEVSNLWPFMSRWKDR